MSYYGSIVICDRTGWSKTYSLKKALTMIGSAQFNDIVLPEEHGSGVAPLQMQVIGSDSPDKSLKVINLVNSAVPRVNTGTSASSFIPPNHSVKLEDGDQLTVGEFSLTFSLNHTGVSYSKRSEHIGVDFELPSLRLRSDGKLAGLLSLTNLGDQNHSQFELDLEGLPADCYQIDPAPVLYPGAREKLAIRFFHKTTRPLAGQCPFTLRVFSPDSYPAEEVQINAVLDVEPVLQFQVEEFPINDPVSIVVKKSNRTATIPNQDSLLTVPPPLPGNLIATSTPVEELENTDEIIFTPAVQPGMVSPSAGIAENPDPSQPAASVGDQNSAASAEIPVDSNWRNVFNNQSSGRKQRASANLQNARVMKAVIEATKTEEEGLAINIDTAATGEVND